MEEGLDKKFHEARPFYTVVIISLLLGLAINYVGISPIQALIYSAILYGLTSPVIIAIVLHIPTTKRSWANLPTPQVQCAGHNRIGVNDRRGAGAVVPAVEGVKGGDRFLL
ncbi:MAG: hypothetical protein WDN75_19480 [Bacteroidota bacterium]